MSKGDEFRKKYSADLRAYLTNKRYKVDKTWREAWLENYAKNNMKEIKEYMTPFSTTLEQVIERVYYDVGKEQSLMKRGL